MVKFIVKGRIIILSVFISLCWIPQVSTSAEPWSHYSTTYEMWDRYRPQLTMLLKKNGYSGSESEIFPSPKDPAYLIQIAKIVCAEKTSVRLTAIACYLSGLSEFGIIKVSVSAGNMRVALDYFDDCIKISALPECNAFKQYIDQAVNSSVRPSNISGFYASIQAAISNTERAIENFSPVFEKRSTWQALPKALRACLEARGDSYVRVDKREWAVDPARDGGDPAVSTVHLVDEIVNICRVPVTFKAWCGDDGSTIKLMPKEAFEVGDTGVGGSKCSITNP